MVVDSLYHYCVEHFLLSDMLFWELALVSSSVEWW
jgi:hypothetical protein